MKVFVITESYVDSTYSEWRTVMAPFYVDKLKAEYECAQLSINNADPEGTSYYVSEYNIDTLPLISEVINT